MVAIPTSHISELPLHDAEFVSISISYEVNNSSQAIIRVIFHPDEDPAPLIPFGVNGRRVEFTIDLNSIQIDDVAGINAGVQTLDGWKIVHDSARDEQSPASKFTQHRLTFSSGSVYNIAARQVHVANW
ncbi:MAG: hypothetical protein IPK83_00140 [Planctomycetes bacterium]|nr:hypothetical protein [Planctomycetota bacterium]